MLKVVAKEVTAQKCPNMIFSLRPGVMRIVAFPSMRQVCAEIKQLQSGQNRGKHPEDNQIFGREP